MGRVSWRSSMKDIFLTINKLTIMSEKILLGLSLALMVILLALGVFCRYILGDPLVWSESIAKLLIVWMTFIGASISFAEKNNIKVDSLVECFPGKIKKTIEICVDIITAIILMYMCHLGFVYFGTTLSSTSPILEVSMGLFSFGMPMMFSLSILHIFANWLNYKNTPSEVETCYQ